jgi:hypothetical protein
MDRITDEQDLRNHRNCFRNFPDSVNPVQFLISQRRLLEQTKAIALRVANGPLVSREVERNKNVGIRVPSVPQL